MMTFHVVQGGVRECAALRGPRTRKLPHSGQFAAVRGNQSANSRTQCNQTDGHPGMSLIKALRAGLEGTHA